MKCWVQITAGRGPAECCWVVTRVADKMISAARQRGLRVAVLSANRGDMPKTLKSMLFSLEGDVDFTEFVRSWKGTVLWTGKSMFRPGHKRRNWFVGVAILTPAENRDQRTDHVRVDRMRSSGPGGQHANKTSSAVRVTHIPTGLCAVASEERSQYHNRKLALARLSDRLRQAREKTRNGRKKDHWQQHNALVRGNAIRVFEGVPFKEKR